MIDRFEICLARILHHEGGYVDHPQDPGGATNLGVTLATLSEYRGRTVTRADVKALTPDTVAPIYRDRYWLAAGCDRLPAGVDYITFDLAVNSGPGRAKRYLQEAVGVTADGAIGPKTIAAVQKANPKELVQMISARRALFYRGLPTFKTFGKGWMRRLEEVTATAMREAS